MEEQIESVPGESPHEAVTTAESPEPVPAAPTAEAAAAAANPAAARKAAPKPAAPKPRPTRPAATKPAAKTPGKKPAAAAVVELQPEAPAAPAEALAAPAAAPGKTAVAETVEPPETSPKAGKPPKAEKAPKREKIVRDSLSLPKSEQGRLKALRDDVARAGRICTKSELLRAGLVLLLRQTPEEVAGVVNALPEVPKGKRGKK